MRFGAYGDPAAVPYEFLEKVVNKASAGYTAYTHQLNHKNFDSRVLDFCMVSTETIKNTQKAQKVGRTFRVVPEDGEILDNEIVCPNFIENTPCNKCMKCDGNLSDNKENIVDEGKVFRKCRTFFMTQILDLGTTQSCRLFDDSNSNHIAPESLKSSTSC